MMFKELDIKCDDINTLTNKFIETFEPDYYYHTNPDTERVKIFIFKSHYINSGRTHAIVIIEYEGDNKYHIEIIVTEYTISRIEPKVMWKVSDFFLENSQLDKELSK